MKKKVGYLLLMWALLPLANIAYAEESPDTQCATNFTDTQLQPTPFMERDNQQTFGCAYGVMSVQVYQYVWAQGLESLDSGATAQGLSQIGATADAAVYCIGPWYYACWQSLYNAEFAAYSAGFARMTAETRKNIKKAEMENRPTLF